MIKFIETLNEDGSIYALLCSTDLPEGAHYEIKARKDSGACVSYSKAGNSNGSIGSRYYWHDTYEQAQAHGFKWAQRKIAEARRVRRRNSQAIDQAVESIKAWLQENAPTKNQ